MKTLKGPALRREMREFENENGHTLLTMKQGKG
jgi:hypothetical protein